MNQITVANPPPPPIEESDDELLITRRPAPKNGRRDVSVTDANGKLYNKVIAKATPDSSKRNRVGFRLELNIRNRADFDLGLWLDELKNRRQFTPVLKQALRLYRDLKAGQYGVLRELFPGVYERILAENCTASAQFDTLLKEIHDLKAQRASGPQTPKLPVLVEDDDDLLTVKKAKSTGKSAENFVSSAFSLI